MEHQVLIPEDVYLTLCRLRAENEHDAEVVKRALEWLDTHMVLSSAAKACDPDIKFEEFGKARGAIRQMRIAGYSEEKTVAVCRVLFCSQSPESMATAFAFFDADKSGGIERQEMKQALLLMGENVPDEKIDALFKVTDIDSSNKVNLDEFSRLVRGLNPKDGAADDAFHAFREGAGAVGTALSSWTENVSAGVSAFSSAWHADLKGLNPLEMRKAGVVINNMRAAGCSEEMAGSVCRALFCEQSDEELKAAFQFYDVNGSGCIDKEEFRRALPMMGENVPPDRVDELLACVDKDKTGKLEFSEFCELVRRMNPRQVEVVPKASSEAGGGLGDVWSKVTSGFGGFWGQAEEAQKPVEKVPVKVEEGGEKSHETGWKAALGFIWSPQEGEAAGNPVQAAPADASAGPASSVADAAPPATVIAGETAPAAVAEAAEGASGSPGSQTITSPEAAANVQEAAPATPTPATPTPAAPAPATPVPAAAPATPVLATPAPETDAEPVAATEPAQGGNGAASAHEPAQTPAANQPDDEIY